MLQTDSARHNTLTIQKLFSGCETHRGRYKGLKEDKKTKIAWEEPQPLNWSQHLSGDMQGKSAVDLSQQKAKWFAVDVDLDVKANKFCKDVFAKLGYEYFVFRTISGRFRVVKFYDDWHNPEQLKQEGEELEKALDSIGYKCDEGSTVPSGWNFKEEKPGRWIYLPYHSTETYCYTPEGNPLTLEQFEFRAQHKTNPLVVASVGLSVGRHKALWTARVNNKVNPSNPIDLKLLNENFKEGVEDFDNYLVHIEKTANDPKWNLESYTKGLPTWIKEMVGTAPNLNTRYVSEVVNEMSDNYIYVRHHKEFYELSSNTWVDKEGLNDDWYHQNKGKPIVKDLLCNPNLIKVHQTVIHPKYPPGVINIGPNDIPGKDKGRYYNLYQPSHFIAIEGDCSPFFEYWKWAIDDDFIADIFFQYSALFFQYPGMKASWWTLISSAPGLGKDLFSEILSSALGHSNCVLNCTFDKLTNDHSTLIEGKQLIVINELMLSGQRIEGKVLTNKLKPYVTNQTAVVNPKFKKEIIIPVYMNGYLYTNDDKPVHLDKEDRRLFVIKCKWSKDEIAKKLKDYLPFFKNLKRNPGIFINAMENYPIPDVGIFEGNAPITEARNELVQYSTDDFYRIMDNAFEERTFPFCRKVFSDTYSSGLPSSWNYRGFVNLDNLETALKYDKKFHKVFFNNFMVQQWVRQNSILWPNGERTKKAQTRGGQRPRLWLIEDLEILEETKDRPSVKVTDLGDVKLGDQYDNDKFKYKEENEFRHWPEKTPEQGNF